MARSFSQEARSDSQKIGEMRYRMSHLPSTTAIARTLLLAGILLAVTVLAARSFFPAFAQTVDDPEEIEYAENGMNPVATFTAEDPEGATIDWTLGGVDALLFSITGGVLSFEESPDFEMPSDDGANRIYDVIVQASDRTTMVSTHYLEITVSNDDEMGEIELSTLAPKEGIDLIATLTDEDIIVTGQNDSISWKWERSEDGSTGWMTSATSTGAVPNNTYQPDEEDAGYFLRVTATYADGEGMDKNADVVSDNKVVMKDYVNRPPKFVDDIRDEDDIDNNVAATTSRSVMENAAAGTAVGAPVRATDTDATNSLEVLTYTLDGTNNNSDDAPFDIDSSTGQIRVKVGQTLNFESPTDAGGNNMYEVTVTATDPGRMASTIDVTIEVTDVNEPPALEAPVVAGDGTVSAGHTAKDHAENTPANTVISTYTATDPDLADVAGLMWSLGGSDSARFEMSPDTGSSIDLTFAEMPNYEAATDRQRNNVYNLTITVTDSAGNSDSRNVAITVTNVEESGSISLSHVRAEVGTRITASLSDPDGVRSTSWSWTVSGTATPVSTSASYTPEAGDSGLAVTATYTDGHGPDKRPTPQSTPVTINATESPQRRPVFKFENGTTTSATWEAIGENETNPILNLNSGDFSIEDPGESISELIYTLGGDTSTFRIETRHSPVITFQPGASFDYERKRSYRVTIRATDPSGDNTTLTLTIPVMDVDESPVIADGGEAIDYPEIKSSRPNTDRVFDYNASDPERKSLTWSLSGANADQFDLDQNGVLTFKSAPDFEGANTPNDKVFNVTVEVTDGTTTAAEKPVAITLLNIDEPGEIALSPTLQPKENQSISAELTDPDGQPDAPQIMTWDTHASTTWQWARSSSRNGPWADIEATSTPSAVTSDTPTYTPSMADRGMYLRPTASYSDDQGDNKAAQAVTDFVVLREDYVNTAPKFDDDMSDEDEQATTSRKVAENAVAGTPVGAPVTATDLGSDEQQEVLTYTMDDDGAASDGDADKFEIDRRTGQISVKDSDSLNFETREDANTDGMYEVVVTATDPTGGQGGMDTIEVTIEVTNVEEPPVISDMPESEGLTGTTTDEHTGIVGGPSTTTILSLYRATDHEDDLISTTTPKWTLSGSDAEMFTIATTSLDADGDGCNLDTTNCAKLTFKNHVDFENPTDSGGNNIYNVTVNVSDSNMMSDSRAVEVKVENVNEMGSITLSHLQPEVGSPFRAQLVDPDGGVSDLTWQWAICDSVDQDGDCVGPVDISGAGATMQAYTPAASDAAANSGDGVYLQVTASYIDAATPMDDPATPADESEAKWTTAGVSINQVQEEVENNDPPSLPDNAISRTILETAGPTNPVMDGNVDGPVVATDNVGGTAQILLYELEGADAAFFTIDTSTADNDGRGSIGQIRVGPDTKLDYDDGRRTYTVVVRATDPAGESDTVTVNINVTNVDEMPDLMRADVTITGDSRIEYLENGTGPVETYGVSGSDAEGATWSRSGPDRSAFSISTDGVLTFDSPPNFEAPTDTGGNNVYDVTVEVMSGGVTTPRSVTVTVTNDDEDEALALDSDQTPLRVGAVLTATLTEADTISGETWEWERSEDGATGWSPIGETTDSYTTVDADEDNFIRVTVTYDDATFGSETLTATTATAVEPVPTGVEGEIVLVAPDPTVGKEITAVIRDGDGPLSNISWQWARSADGSTGWTDIGSPVQSTSAGTGYTPVEDDAGQYLRVTVTYDDASGPNQTAEEATSDRVRIDSYDANADGVIDGPEVLQAVRDYFDDDIDGPTVLRVVRLYFAGLS